MSNSSKVVKNLSVDGSDDILIEVEEVAPQPGGLRAVGAGGQVGKQITKNFNQALDQLKPAANALLDKLRTLDAQPSEIEVEFGIKFNAKTEAFIASSSLDANFKIALTWKKPE